MSAGENFLVRWSRRKRDAANTPRGPGGDAKPATGQAGDDDDSEASGSADAAAGTRAELPCEPPSLPTLDLTKLPPIDAITATTDIRPFFAAGVPEELKHAALRRAWLADPAIRDFVGIAENQWDFTAGGAPGGAPGFGPLSAADDIGKLLAQVFGDEADESAQLVSGAAPGESSQPVKEAGKSVDAQAADQAEAAAPMADDRSRDADLKVALDSRPEGVAEADVILQKTRAYIAVQNKTDPHDSKVQSSQRSHGRALPK
jgi:Protein of unknown function (DUF3306)